MRIKIDILSNENQKYVYPIVSSKDPDGLGTNLKKQFLAMEN